MNKVPTQDLTTISTAVSFSRLLRDSGLTDAELAKIAGVERKLVCQWRNCQKSPKLDYVAKIFFGLGFFEIRLPFRLEKRGEV